eukprot:Nitzschia sp. Nitz4//scaffold2_size372955//325075//325887//NITZ4_000469-RA/size372955-processed-gene-0.455-mRNA-1//1//CDS//3329546916//515//frame0
MVSVEELPDTTPSQERLLDAEEIEAVAKTLTRPTARMQLESLAKKLRKESAALKVVENTQSASTTATAPKETSTPQNETKPAPAKVAPPQPAPIPATKVEAAPITGMYSTIDRFAFDAGGYNDKFVTLYISLPGVGEIPKEQITCEFSKDAFDLIVRDLRGQSYRLKKDHLEHDIVVDKSKYIVKADKIVVKLAKVKGEYGSFDLWNKLTDPKRNDKAPKANPASSLTSLMKDMYESGDDEMRKMIGETMLKQQRGELGKGAGMDDIGGL